MHYLTEYEESDIRQQAAGPAATTVLPLAQQHALQDLQESHDIAQRGGMCLHLTDYHLEFARLALTVCFHPYDGSLPSSERELKQQAAEHIEQATRLIKETCYKRRLPEVTYLEAILLPTNKHG